MENETAILKELIGLINEISAISCFKFLVKQQCRDLSRRLKLLIPLFEELMELKYQLCEHNVRSLLSLKEGLESAKELLTIGSRGSKIFMSELMTVAVWCELPHIFL